MSRHRRSADRLGMPRVETRAGRGGAGIAGRDDDAIRARACNGKPVAQLVHVHDDQRWP